MMIHRPLSGIVLSGLAVAIGASLALAGPPFAQKTPDGKTLEVPPDLARRGTVYYALPGRDRQIFFESDAPVEDINGQSNQVIGFAVAGSPGNRAELVGGEWHLPVRSIDTGIPLRNKHLAGPDWLDAENHPNIVFQLNEVRNIRLKKRTDRFETYGLTLVGDMTIHGVTKELVIPNATVTFLSESDATRRIADGDIMAIRAEYPITLADFNVEHPVIGERMARTVQVDTSLYLSTVPPSEQ